MILAKEYTNRSVGQNREPRNRPPTSTSQLLFDKEAKKVFSTNDTGTIGHPHVRKKKIKNIVTDLTPFTRI